MATKAGRPKETQNAYYGSGRGPEVENPAFPTEKYVGNTKSKEVYSPHASTFTSTGGVNESAYDALWGKKE